MVPDHTYADAKAMYRKLHRPQSKVLGVSSTSSKVLGVSSTSSKVLAVSSTSSKVLPTESTADAVIERPVLDTDSPVEYVQNSDMGSAEESQESARAEEVDSDDTPLTSSEDDVTPDTPRRQGKWIRLCKSGSQYYVMYSDTTVLRKLESTKEFDHLLRFDFYLSLTRENVRMFGNAFCALCRTPAETSSSSAS